MQTSQGKQQCTLKRGTPPTPPSKSSLPETWGKTFPDLGDFDDHVSSGRAVLFSGWIAMLMIYKVDYKRAVKTGLMLEC